jgi:molybdenum cofactor cytidylyltransferase
VAVAWFDLGKDRRLATGEKRRPFISGLLLAAGGSSRFGRIKQLERLGGMTLVERAVDVLRRSRVDERVVVVGNVSAEVLERLDLGSLRVVINPGFGEGLSSSLRAGVSALDKRSEAVVVCLADQPFVTSGLVDHIVMRFLETGAAAIASASDGLVSPPMLLSKTLYREIERLREDRGAKSIAMAQPTFQRVETDRDALLDVDTPQDMARAKALLLSRPREKGLEAGALSRGRPSSDG